MTKFGGVELEYWVLALPQSQLGPTREVCFDPQKTDSLSLFSFRGTSVKDADDFKRVLPYTWVLSIG